MINYKKKKKGHLVIVSNILNYIIKTLSIDEEK